MLFRRLIHTYLVIALLTTSCASLPSSSVREDEFYVFKFPYRYESLGAGNAGVMLPIVQFGKDAEFFSLALRQALQEQEFSIIKPEAINGPFLPQKTQIETDAVGLPRSTIQDHNKQFPMQPMSLKAKYRLSYELVYGFNKELVEFPRNFWLNVRPKLEWRAAAGEWHLYSQSYSGKFFAEMLYEIVASKLPSPSGQNL